MSPRQFDLYVVERECVERFARRTLWLVAHVAGAYYWAASLRAKRRRPKDIRALIDRAELTPTSFGFRPLDECPACLAVTHDRWDEEAK